MNLEAVIQDGVQLTAIACEARATLVDSPGRGMVK